jgi:hypothetical protein
MVYSSISSLITGLLFLSTLLPSYEASIIAPTSSPSAWGNSGKGESILGEGPHLEEYLHQEQHKRGYDITLSYPLRLLQPITGTHFSGEADSNSLTCFGNRDYPAPTLFETMLCLLGGDSGGRCHGVWGTRTVHIATNGSIELLRLSRLPSVETSSEFDDGSEVRRGDTARMPSDDFITVNATRWFQAVVLDASSDESVYVHSSMTTTTTTPGGHSAVDTSVISRSFRLREIRSMPAEPVYVCVRSIDWRLDSTTHFTLRFRPAFIRDRDMLASFQVLLALVAALVLLSIWPRILNIIVVMCVSYLTYTHALKKFMFIYAICCVNVLILPLWLSRETKRVAWRVMKSAIVKQKVIAAYLCIYIRAIIHVYI